uniref:Uncharacterized protein n=1 Tax=Timema poppense TaxID=170557 RepID=A0A7R9DHH8_TIMPO|nr:unnamed protein product [Timema poppensis]
MCHRYNLSFNNMSAWNIVQNSEDLFRGERIVILYDPGQFPALLKGPNGKIVHRNGGVPQEGNLTHHLMKIRQDIDRLVSNRFFDDTEVLRRATYDQEEREGPREVEVRVVCDKDKQPTQSSHIQIGKTFWESYK